MTAPKFESNQARPKGVISLSIAQGLIAWLILMQVFCSAEAKSDIIMTKGKLIMRGGKNEGNLIVDTSPQKTETHIPMMSHYNPFAFYPVHADGGHQQHHQPPQFVIHPIYLEDHSMIHQGGGGHHEMSHHEMEHHEPHHHSSHEQHHESVEYEHHPQQYHYGGHHDEHNYPMHHQEEEHHEEEEHQHQPEHHEMQHHHGHPLMSMLMHQAGSMPQQLYQQLAVPMSASMTQPNDIMADAAFNAAKQQQELQQQQQQQSETQKAAETSSNDQKQAPSGNQQDHHSLASTFLNWIKPRSVKKETKPKQNQQ